MDLSQQWFHNNQKEETVAEKPQQAQVNFWTLNNYSLSSLSLHTVEHAPD